MTTLLRRHSLKLLLLLAVATPAARAEPPEPRLSGEQLRADVALLRRALTELHPGLYRYSTPAQVEARFTALERELGGGASQAQAFLAVTRLAASVRCGHTWTNPLNQAKEVQTGLFERADKLPLRFEVIGRRFLVVASAAEGIAAGDELTAINGRAVGAIIDELKPYLRADGSSDGKRLSLLGAAVDPSLFDLYFPLLHPPGEEGYLLTLRTGGRGPTRQVRVRPLTVEARKEALAKAGAAPPPEDWTFQIDEGLGVLTLPTFAFWRSKFDWRGFLDRSFAELRERKVRNLVIDLRRNEGGDSAIRDALLAYLAPRPLSLEDYAPRVRYETVPPELASHLDTWDRSFFARTGRVRRVDERMLEPTDLVKPQATLQPVAEPYTGRTFVLIGPVNSSASFAFANVVKRERLATLVGQTTGGNQRGLNGGQIAWLTLPHSGIAVDIPLVAWVARTPRPDAGVTPDISVTRRLEALAAGKDLEMEAVRALLGSR